MPRLAIIYIFLRVSQHAAHRKPTIAKAKNLGDGHPILLK
jgi:hypothetical protein